MMSQSASTADRILDAALDLACDGGPAAATVSAVADRAGVSRMTVYRKFPDRERLLAELLNRELSAIATRSLSQAAGLDSKRAQVSQTVAAGVQALRGHPLLQAVLRHEPESLTPWLTQRLGATQRMAVAALTELIAAGQQEGSIRSGDPSHLASVVVIAAQSFVVAPGIELSPDDAHRLVDGYLTPHTRSNS